MKALKADKTTAKDSIQKEIAKLLSLKESFKSKIQDFLPKSTESLENLIKFEDLIRSRFFYDQSFSIYKGVAGFYDLGPLGCKIQSNLVNEWRKFFIAHDYMLEVDCPILTPHAVLKASGHLSKFSDLMCKDQSTGQAFRVDHLLKSEFEKLKAKLANDSSELKKLNEIIQMIETSSFSDLNELDRVIEKYNIKSPITGNKLGKVEPFNLMFKTQVGASGNVPR